MKIRTEYDPRALLTHWEWTAWDESTYDGAEDAGPSARAIGCGPTEAEAIADLMEQLES
jgi:hypothetical protein